MNQALHFAWWLTVPGSDESQVMLYATGASIVAEIQVRADGRTLRPFFNQQPNPSMPPVFWWPNKGAVYTARVKFKDGSVVELPPLDMKTKLWPTSPVAPFATPTDHRQHTLYRSLHFTNPLNAKMGWSGKAELDLWLDGCTFNGGGLDKIDNWFPGWRRVFITNCEFHNAQSGPQGASVELVRDALLIGIGGDALSDARVVWSAAVADHVKGRADLHPDTYQFRSRGPLAEPKLLAGIKDQSRGSQGIFADRSTAVRNVAIVNCKIGTDGVGAALSLETRADNVLIDNCEFFGPTYITPSRANVVIRKTPGVS